MRSVSQTIFPCPNKPSNKRCLVQSCGVMCDVCCVVSSSFWHKLTSAAGSTPLLPCHQSPYRNSVQCSRHQVPTAVMTRLTGQTTAQAMRRCCIHAWLRFRTENLNLTRRHHPFIVMMRSTMGRHYVCPNCIHLVGRMSSLTSRSMAMQALSFGGQSPLTRQTVVAEYDMLAS